jgi:hypothetical protein
MKRRITKKRVTPRTLGRTQRKLQWFKDVLRVHHPPVKHARARKSYKNHTWDERRALMQLRERFYDVTSLTYNGTSDIIN